MHLDYHLLHAVHADVEIELLCISEVFFAPFRFLLGVIEPVVDLVRKVAAVVAGEKIFLVERKVPRRAARRV